MSGGVFTLVGGFWFKTPPGDCNSDGTANLGDYASFASCLGGPDGSAEGNCRCYDVNQDGHVDLIDVGEFQKLFNASE